MALNKSGDRLHINETELKRGRVTGIGKIGNQDEINKADERLVVKTSQ